MLGSLLFMRVHWLRATFSFCLLVVFQMSFSVSSAQDDAAVYNLLQTAANAQRAGDFQIAISQYEQVFKQHPDSPEIGKAYYNAGVCCVETEQYARAIAYLTRASDKLGSERAVLLPQSKLLLGFAQLRLGKLLAADRPAESNQALAAAAQNLTGLIEQHPDFVDIDQAYFFQADALDGAQKFDQAITAYRQMLELPKVQFAQDGQFALANLYERTGQLDQALKGYEQFLVDHPKHGLAVEVRFRLAETLSQMGVDAAANNQADLAKQLYQRSEANYQAVVDAEADGLSAEAQMQLALVASRQQDYARSAKLYLQASQLPAGSLTARALTYAGRDLFRSNQLPLAIETLNKVTSLESPYAAEAAHWLAKAYLHGNQFEEAYAVAHPWIDKTDDARLKVPLMMDAADAAYGSESRRADSVGLYLQIADQYGQSPLAPTALYNAAYAAMEVGEFEQAMQLTERFEKQYPQNSFLPDALEVKADTALLVNDAATAQSVFRRLVDNYPKHAKQGVWRVRVGLAAYLQGHYQETIDWLQPSIDQLNRNLDLAEAWHWIGSSLFQLNRHADAIAALKSSQSAAADWRRGDETLLTLARALEANQQTEQAQATARQLLDNYPESPLRAETMYRLGEAFYGQGDIAQAQALYDAVIQQHTNSKFVPFALYGQGWSQINQNDFQAASVTFSQLLDSYPKHSLAQQALMGRATSLRRDGQNAAALLDIKQALQRSSDDSGRTKILYELGLAQAEQKDWKEAILAFEELVKRAPRGDQSDQFHYELAWAQRSGDQIDASHQTFLTLATEFPVSPHAAEANFHVAQNAYDKQEFDRAIEHYGLCLKTSGDAKLKEKAAYKRAWSHYKRGEFKEAQNGFAKQVEQHKDGPLYADGLFMVSESLYKLRDHASAFQAYRVAKPVVDASGSVAPKIRYLTMLHGGQSANQSKLYAEAIEFMKPIVEGEVDREIQQDANLEMGIAHAGMKQLDQAVACWELAATNLGATGAHARCLLGDQLFTAKKFEDAITQYKLTFYGYGGTAAAAEVKAWQAYALYEAARCRVVQMGIASTAEAQQKFKDEAIKHFQSLIENYPEDRLTEQGSKELAKLLQSNTSKQ